MIFYRINTLNSFLRYVFQQVSHHIGKFIQEMSECKSGRQSLIFARRFLYETGICYYSAISMSKIKVEKGLILPVFCAPYPSSAGT